MNGESYTGQKGLSYVTKEPRHMGPSCHCKLGHKVSGNGNGALRCTEFTEAERQKIFHSFWKEQDWEQKKVFVMSTVDVKSVGRRVTESQESRQKASMVFNLKKNGERKRVCKEFFLSTLNIGEWSLYSWVKKGNQQDNCSLPGIKSEMDRRNHSKIRNVDPKRKAHAESFLSSLPKLESHYCRSSTSTTYFEPIWKSVSELYREYCTKSQEDDLEPISRITFTKIFKQHNLSLFTPKKDQCDLCCSHEAGNADEGEYETHLLRKELARLEKQRDKTQKDQVYTMDLQAVLLAPRLQASALYYKTKMCVHNFTIFNLGSKDGICISWHEGEGGFSANDFTSVICHFVEGLDLAKNQEVTLWSDGCTYQNRNATLSNGLLSVAVKKQIIIYQKYLVKGHTQMECDSMHSTIEKRLKNVQVRVPADYVAAFRTARASPAPYEVNYIDHTFFKDYSTLNYYAPIRPSSSAGDPVVTDIVALCYKPDGDILYKLNFDDNWMPFPVRQSGRRKMPMALPDVGSIPVLYKSSLPIKTEKFLHLQQLKHVLPKDYHNFYDSLAHICATATSNGGCSHIIPVLSLASSK